MARPLVYDRRNIVGQGIIRNPESRSYGRHRLNPQKLQCDNCGAIMFSEERTSGPINNPIFSMCCSSKTFRLPNRNPTPELILNMLRQSTDIGKLFVHNIRLYNTMFAFTSFNANVNYIIFLIF